MSKKSQLRIKKIFYASTGTKQEIPLYSSRVSAGFPSPAEDYITRQLDLNDLLIKRPAATFFVEVEGDSMLDAGIHDGDILVVDRGEMPANNKIVVAALDGELTVKKIAKIKGKLYLLPENPDFDPMEISGEMELMIWGIVTYVIHKV
ncbi:MAG: translesion error-prone DNA polymerase V autoproteolytic subunit [bacterium]